MKTTSQTQDSAPGLQSRTESHSRAEGDSNTGQTPLNNISFERRRANSKLRTGPLLNLLRVEAPDFLARVDIVEQRIAIRFDAKQPRTVTALLSELGFRWNWQRQLWEHPCGQFSAGSRKSKQASRNA